MRRGFVPVFALASLFLCSRVFAVRNSDTKDEDDSGQKVFDLDLDRNREKYDAGKAQFEMVAHYSKMPEYGQCWINAIENIQRGCKALTDEMQSRMALQYLNCFLELQGRSTYPCSEFQSLPSCTKDMIDGDRSSYATFFTHTQNICYFLQSQAWHQETQKTISSLAENSALVANQLEESSQLQEKMLNQQNMSLQNQNQLIDQASNLSRIIANSSSDVRFMFDEFNKTTQEQKLLIFDVFDRVARLQSLVLGEFTGFYSIIFYTLSILISYMLTSTPRTSGARFGLFGIMTLNIIVERLILSRNSTITTEAGTVIEEIDESVVYCRQWWCRQISCVLGLVLLAVCAYRYRDLNIINNQLLVEIRKQNSDLKKFILTGGTPQRGAVPDSLDSPGEVTQGNITHAITADTGHTTGYESDSNYSSDSGTDSDSGQSDRTYLADDDADMDTSSVDDRYSTAPSRSSSRASTPSLMDEVNDLWNSTPVRELRQQNPEYSPWYGPGGDHVRNLGRSPRPARRFSTPLRSDVRPGLMRYFLRDRSLQHTSTNPVVNTESPESFSKTVKHLAKLASKNSMLAKFTVHRRNLPLGSSEDEA